MVPFNQGWAKDAPVFIVVACDTLFSKNRQLNRWAAYDSGACAQNMAIQAHSLGLMAHQIGGFDDGQLKLNFSIPSSIDVLSIMAIGYEKKGAELSLRQRKNFDQIAQCGQWTFNDLGT